MIEGKTPIGSFAGVGIKRHPPSFARFDYDATEGMMAGLPAGSLRCLLTLER
jgi:hypothetical protein